MNELVPDRLDEPWTCSAMAKQVGVAPTTLANWAKRDQSPLTTVKAPNGDAMYTWRHLLDFCSANPNLHATRQVLQHYREHFAVDRSSGPSQPLSGSSAIDGSVDRPASIASDSSHGATLRSRLQDLKTEVEAHSTVVAAAARLAEDVAHVQAGLLNRLVLLEAEIITEAQRGHR